MYMQVPCCGFIELGNGSGVLKFIKQQTYSVYPFCEACMSPVKPYLSGTSMGTSLKYENKAHQNLNN